MKNFSHAGEGHFIWTGPKFDFLNITRTRSLLNKTFKTKKQNPTPPTSRSAKWRDGNIRHSTGQDVGGAGFQFLILKFFNSVEMK